MMQSHIFKSINIAFILNFIICIITCGLGCISCSRNTKAEDSSNLSQTINKAKESVTDLSPAKEQTVIPKILDYYINHKLATWSDTFDRYIIQYYSLNNFDPKEIVKYQFVPDEDDEWAQINFKTSKDTTYYYGIKYNVVITDLKDSNPQPDTIEITRNMFLRAAKIADIDRRCIDFVFPLDTTGDTVLLGVRLRFLPCYGDIDGGVYYFGKGKPLKLEVKFDKYN